MNTLKKRTLKTLGLSILTLLLASCAQYSATNPPPPNPKQKEILKAVFVNPFPPGTYAHFKASPSYRSSYKTWKHPELFSSTPATQTRIVIDLSDQRGVMYKGDTPIYDYPISSGKRKYPTPTGSFKVLEKLKADKRSSLYGKIYDAEGKVVNRDADSRKDSVPEGGRFEGALMAYWMRITWDGVGMHKGRVPRYPASHGCIRTHSSAVATVFNKVIIGTPVEVVE